MRIGKQICTISILLLFVILLSCAGTYGPGESARDWIFTFKDGSRISAKILKYDDRKTEFRISEGRKRKTFFIEDLQSIHALDISRADSIQEAPAPDVTDWIEKRDGTVIQGIFWNWSRRDIAYRIPEEGEQGKGVLLPNLRKIVFGRRIFTVERINWKKGMNFFSEEEEISMGNQFTNELKYEEFIVDDPVIKAYIQNLGDRLARNSFRHNLKYSFNVINSDQVNAFAVPGGHIYVYRGLIELADTENELAGVIGHEIGHIAGYHSAQQLSKTMLIQGIVQGLGLAVGLKDEKWGFLIQTFGGIGAYFAQMKFSRDDEREADYMGIYTLYKAGYQPSGMMNFFEKMHKASGGDPGKFQSFFQSHPRTTERIQNAKREMQKLPPDASFRETSPAFDAFRNKVQKLPKPYLAAKNPGKHLTIQRFQFQPPQTQRSQGKGLITIRNTSNFTMGKAVLKLHYINNRGREIGTYSFGISGAFVPGESATIDVYKVIADTAPRGTSRVDVSLLQAAPVPIVHPESRNQPRQILLLK